MQVSECDNPLAVRLAVFDLLSVGRVRFHVVLEFEDVSLGLRENKPLHESWMIKLIWVEAQLDNATSVGGLARKVFAAPLVFGASDVAKDLSGMGS
jgi:hypothetical protein